MAFWDFFKGRKKKTSTMESVAVDKGVPSSEEDAAAEEESATRDEDFMAEHFEALGDIWYALFGEDDSLESLLSAVLDHAQVLEHDEVAYDDGTYVLLYQYPDVGDIRAGALVGQKPDSDRMEFWSCFPIMQGLPNPLKIRKSHTWENGVEGVVAAEQAESGAVVSFFAPFYFREFENFTRGAELTMHLAALAFSCEKAEAQEITVEEGPFYEMQLKEFLDENPDKTAADFSAPVFSMRGFRSLLPRTYSCIWEYRCPVLAVEQTTFFDKVIYKLHVIFVGTDEEELAGYLYAPEYMLNGFVPQAGDDIQGVLWMTGYQESE